MSKSAAPEGMHSITPYLIVPDVGGLMRFLHEVFNAQTVLEPMKRQDGSIMHAELRLGDSMLMMGEPVGEHTAMPASMYVYVKDCDGTIAKAIAAGGEVIMEAQDQPHGDRYGGVKDPNGNRWWIAQRIREVPESEYRSSYEHGD